MNNESQITTRLGEAVEIFNLKINNLLRKNIDLKTWKHQTTKSP
jgi:hypothetical protein